MILQVSNDKNTWYEVELDGDVIIPFVFAVDDIRENVKRTSYSKNFTIKGTPRNIQLFAAIYQTHAANVRAWSRVVFDRPVYARLYGEAVLVYEGMLMITQVRYEKGAVEFDVAIFDSQAERLSLLLNLPLSHLSFPLPYTQISEFSQIPNAAPEIVPAVMVPMDMGESDNDTQLFSIDSTANVRNFGGDFRRCVAEKTPVWVSVRALLSILLGKTGLRFDDDSLQFWGVRPPVYIGGTAIPNLEPTADAAVKRLFITSAKTPMKVSATTAFAVTYGYRSIQQTNTYIRHLYDSGADKIVSGGSAGWATIAGTAVKYRTADRKIYLSGTYDVAVMVSGTLPAGCTNIYVIVRANGVAAIGSITGTTWQAQVNLRKVTDVEVTVEVTMPPNCTGTPSDITVAVGLPQQLINAPMDNFDFASAVPEMTVGEFLAMLMKMFNMVSYIYGNSWRFLPMTKFWQGITIDLSDRVDYNQAITITLPITSQPRFYMRSYTDIDGAYYYKRYKVEQGRSFGFLRYDLKLFFNKDTDEYECPLSLPLPTYHPVWRNQFGLSYALVPRLTDGNRTSSVLPPNGMIGYVRKKFDSEPEDVIADRLGAGQSWRYYSSHWRVDFQYNDAIDSQSLVFDLPKNLFRPTNAELYLPTIWQRFHLPIIDELTSADTKLVALALRFEPYEIGSGSQLLWRPIQIDGVVYRFHRIGEIDILRGGVYNVELLRRKPAGAVPGGTTVLPPTETPDKPNDIASRPTYVGSVVVDSGFVPAGVPRAEFSPMYGGGIVTFSKDWSPGSVVAVRNNSPMPLQVDTQSVEGLVVVPPAATAIFGLSDNGKAFLLWQG